jgi:4Fe-4S single cluster domain of Ferredoxin I
MADVANKYPENAPGKFYVDEQCIDCDLCRETAPANFNAMTTADILTFINRLKTMKSKPVARKRWKDARSKRSVTMARRLVNN